MTIIDHLRLKAIKGKEEAKIDRTLVIEIKVGHTVETDKDKTLDPTIGDKHKTDIYNVDMAVGDEVIDIKIKITEVTVEIEGDNISEETLAMTNMTIEIGIAEQEKEV